MSIWNFVQGLVKSIPKAAESIKEWDQEQMAIADAHPDRPTRESTDRHRPLGSVAYRNGEKVLWAGQDWDYQSPGSFNELVDKGEIKIEEKYHGEIATDNVLKTLSRAAQSTSDFLEQHEYGRNLKGNLSNFAKGAGDHYDYLIDEADRKWWPHGGPSTTGEWGSLIIGSILKDREKYSKKFANALSQLKIGDRGIDPRILQIGTEEGIDALLTLGLSGVAKGAFKTATNLKLPGAPLVPKLINGADSLPIRQAGQADELSTVLKMDTAAKVGTYKPKTNALARYNEMILQGYDFKDNKTINNLVAKMKSSNASNLPKNIKQYTDEALYRAEVTAHLDGGGKTADIRKKIGVFVDKDGSVRQMQSRGKMQLVRIDKDTNTNLNRALDIFKQSPEYTSYNRIANVRHFMQEIGFKGDEKQFKALYELHHVNAIKVYSPFFKGLKPKQVEKLRRLAEGTGIYLGNDPRNLVPLLKRKHRIDPDSIHTFMRENGIEGNSKWSFLSTAGNKPGSYNPQARMAALLEGRSVQERFEVMKGFKEWVQNPVNTELSKLRNTIAK